MMRKMATPIRVRMNRRKHILRTVAHVTVEQQLQAQAGGRQLQQVRVELLSCLLSGRSDDMPGDGSTADAGGGGGSDVLQRLHDRGSDVSTDYYRSSIAIEDKIRAILSRVCTDDTVHQSCRRV